MTGSTLRAIVGGATVAALVTTVIVAVGLFRGSFADTVPLTVMSPRAGLVMNPDAKVKLLGVPVGSVGSIEERPDGQAAIHLEMDPSQLAQIPDNVVVDIASATVFGAKSVDLIPPANPSIRVLQPGQVLAAEHVTVEFNTIFEELTSVLSKVQPEKLNETLGAIASAFDGRGPKFGQTLSDLDQLLVRLEPSLPNLSHDLAVAPAVLDAYADAAPDLLSTARSAIQLSQTLVDEQKNLDAFLVSTIGLADIGNDVVGTNRRGLTDLLHLLVPTTDLTSRYHEAITCTLAGIIPLVGPPLDEPGIVDSIGFQWGRERYRYPGNLPKVAATGGAQCLTLPRVPFNSRPPFVVADVGANPAQYGNQKLLINSDGLKQLLFGPIDGPPRNTAQVGTTGMTGVRGPFVKFGAFALVMALLTGVLFLIFGQYRTGSTNEYSAAFADVSGLQPGDSVRAGGLRVGTVTGVSMQPDHTVLVAFDADRVVPMTTGTTLAVRYLNLVGDRFLELIDGPGSTRILPAGSRITVDRTTPALDLDLLLGGLKPVIQGLNPQDVNALSAALLQVFQGQGGTLDSLLSKTASFSGGLADNNEVIEQLIDNLNRVVGTLADNGTEFSGAIDRLERLVGELSAERDPIGNAIESLDRGTASLADLLGQARPPLAGTVNQLSRLAPLLDGDKEKLDTALQRAPGNYKKLIRLGAYGSWLNIYICSLSFRVSDRQGNTAVFPWFKQANGRCAE